MKLRPHQLRHYSSRERHVYEVSTLLFERFPEFRGYVTHPAPGGSGIWGVVDIARRAFGPAGVAFVLAGWVLCPSVRRPLPSDIRLLVPWPTGTNGPGFRARFINAEKPADGLDIRIEESHAVRLGYFQCYSSNDRVTPAMGSVGAMWLLSVVEAIVEERVALLSFWRPDERGPHPQAMMVDPEDADKLQLVMSSYPDAREAYLRSWRGTYDRFL